MGLFDGFKPLKWMKADYTDPRNRYIYIDGSPYGTGAIARVLTNPKMFASTAVGFFYAAGVALSYPAGQQRAKLLDGVIISLVFCSAYFIQESSYISRNLPDLKGAVIDKTGRAISDPSLEWQLKDFLSDNALASIVMAPTLAAVFGFGLGVVPWAYLAYQAVSIAYSFYAKRKLERKEWSVQPKPPKLTQEETIPAGEMEKVPVVNNYITGRAVRAPVI